MERIILLIVMILMARAASAHDAIQDGPHLHLSEVIGMVGGVVAILMGILGFLVRRTVFMEIDELKQAKQDKVICEQPLKEIVFLKEHKVDRLVCEKIEAVACRDREEIKDGLREGIQEFKAIHKKIDRIMWKMKLSSENDDNGS